MYIWLGTFTSFVPLVQCTFKWLTKSGLKINESNTKLCLLHRNDQLHVTLQIDDHPINSKSNMNVLGVTFDLKLNWQTHISKTITKASEALHASNVINKNVNRIKLLQFITFDFFSIWRASM